MSRNPLQDVVIIASYNTQQARRLEGANDMSLMLEVIPALLERAGVGADQVDGVNVSTPVWGLNGRETIQLLGGQPRWCGNEFMGIAAVLEAAGAIATGQAEMIMIAHAQAGEYSYGEATSPWTRPTHEFSECWGLYTAAEFAFCAQRHMHLYGTRQEALAEVAATIRRNGNKNPKGCFYDRGEVTPEDVLASRMVASPFHLLDCCINSEGGGGLMLTTAERARDLDVVPIHILGGGTDRQGMAYTRAPVWDTYGWVGRRAAERSFEMAGLRPTDVDVCEFYDPFSFEIIRQFEAFGFCAEGEGGDFVMDGRIAVDGEFPVVTNGGTLSFSHAGTLQMLQKVISGYEQLSGQLPAELTVPDANVAIASNGGSGALFCDVMLMGREPT
ncbi:thiolase family protein [Halieaceae bacterium IMCC14734]|uniref:Thiolase family protein n=1 Tax=Candidatus Litorirhabdus singularis TaxID=2518993 RepID=A0ABT3TJ05_9GAMM|nr:thiolase family protein [Candidatus Litorirhabdus singularis]MCX2982266.1 thiolase family protein [Candidatus Litorirhabdus singularis]